VALNHLSDRYVWDEPMTNETFEKEPIDIRLVVALDNEILSWTMCTVMGTLRNVTIIEHKQPSPPQCTSAGFKD
jgi:hypothetical protein